MGLENPQTKNSEVSLKEYYFTNKVTILMHVSYRWLWKRKSNKEIKNVTTSFHRNCNHRFYSLLLLLWLSVKAASVYGSFKEKRRDLWDSAIASISPLILSPPALCLQKSRGGVGRSVKETSELALNTC